MAHRTNVADLPRLLTLVVSFLLKFPLCNDFIITISTIFNKYKKQKSKIVKIVENLRFFQQVFNKAIFSTKLIKILKNRQKIVKNFVKNVFSTISTALTTKTKYKYII